MFECIDDKRRLSIHGSIAKQDPIEVRAAAVEPLPHVHR